MIIYEQIAGNQVGLSGFSAVWVEKFGFKSSPAVATPGTEPIKLLLLGHQHVAGGAPGDHPLSPSK